MSDKQKLRQRQRETTERQKGQRQTKRDKERQQRDKKRDHRDKERQIRDIRIKCATKITILLDRLGNCLARYVCK